MFVKFKEIFGDSPPVDNQYYSYYGNNDNKGNDRMSMNSDPNANLCHRSSRLSAGTHRNAAYKLISSPSQCKLQPAGLKFSDAKKQVNAIHLQPNDVQMKASVEGLMLPQQRRNVVQSRTRATQTLFRESSAQTLPYLPGVSNDYAELETLEIFKLPTILPGNGPPGLYEAEVLERARRRWAFAKALKENFRKQLEAAKEQAKLQDHEQILEAFEWEYWIEREENIQECQMLRLELLIHMFDKREREMHMASKTRIQKSCEEIEAKRKAALKKNEIEYNRAIRRLEIKHAKQPRVWCKENITQELGDPSSEFYAPKMRYGVNPSRRHYTASGTSFDMRMDDLKRKVIKMDPKNLKCPFSKLRQWSKPKEVVQEVEQNFCSEANLNKLYENLRTLRETSRKQKYNPLCLKAKKLTKKVIIEEPGEIEPAIEATIEKSTEAMEIHTSDETINKRKSNKTLVSFKTAYIDERNSLDSIESSESFEELRQQKQAERLNMEVLRKEIYCEELEALINSYEGNTIGWLMRFLSDEMCRLKEQRKLQFFTMMAKRERWHREAAEGGLRQKENSLREDYEKIYDECDQINTAIADKFLSSILNTDIHDYAHQKAEQDVVNVAKDLDKEIAVWLESFGEVQNSLNYQTLRHALKDIVVPDVNKILYRLEKDNCIDYIINNVLLEKVYHDLEPYEVSFSIASDFVDRLFDNDLYVDSPDCSSDCDCPVFCSCTRAQKEASTILRKLIRYAVPGRLWYSDEERIASEIVRELLDDVLDKVVTQNSIIDIDISNPPHITSQRSHTNLVCFEKDIFNADHLDEPVSFKYDDQIKFQILNPTFKTTVTDITKDLRWSEDLLLEDPDKLSNDALLIDTNKYVLPGAKAELSTVRIIPSTHDISRISEFRAIPDYAQTSSEERSEKTQLEAEEIEDEISLSYQGFAEQLESGGANYENQEEKQPEIEVEELTELEELKKSITYQTIKISENPDEKFFDDESTEEEDESTSGFIKVAFSYNSQVKFSVAVPSNDEVANEESADDVSNNNNNLNNEKN